MAEELSYEERLALVENLLMLILRKNFDVSDADQKQLMTLLTNRPEPGRFSHRSFLNLLESLTRRPTHFIVDSREPELHKKLDALLEQQDNLVSFQREIASLGERLQYQLSSNLQHGLDQLKQQLDQQRRSEIELLLAVQDLPTFRRVRMRRALQISFHFSGSYNAKATALLSAAERFYNALGFDSYYEFPVQRGSWGKEVYAKARELLTGPEAKSAAKMAKRAIELAHIDKKQAEVTRDLAAAAKDMTESLKDQDEGIISLGNIFVLKTVHDGKSQIRVLQLTQEEMEFVESHRELLWNVNEFKSALENRQSQANERKLATFNVQFADDSQNPHVQLPPPKKRTTD